MTQPLKKRGDMPLDKKKPYSMTENELEQELERMDKLLLAGELGVPECRRLKHIRRALAKLEDLKEDFF